MQNGGACPRQANDTCNIVEANSIFVTSTKLKIETIYYQNKIIQSLMNLKESILELRKKGFSYPKIAEKLNCSRSTVSYHCNDTELNFVEGVSRQIISDNKKNQIREFYKTHTTKETSEHFNVSISAVKRCVEKKRKLDSESEKKEKNYQRVKQHRQKMKMKAVEYKGGKCQKCGYHKSIWSLDFHHMDPEEKDFGISQYQYLSWEKIKKELDKCIMICKNCHGELHEEEYKLKLSRNSPS